MTVAHITLITVRLSMYRICHYIHPDHPSFFFFFNDTPTTEIYTLSLHDALPICRATTSSSPRCAASRRRPPRSPGARARDRKSTRLNSSHRCISYAVFCLKKKKKKNKTLPHRLIIQYYTSII